MLPVLYGQIYIRLQRTSNNTVSVVIIGIQRKSFNKDSIYYKIKTWFSMVDVYGSTGGNNQDGTLIFEIPLIFWYNLEILHFIDEYGIVVNKI